MPPKKKAQKEKQAAQRPPTPKSEHESVEAVKPDPEFTSALESLDSVVVGCHSLENVLSNVYTKITDRWVSKELPEHCSRDEVSVQEASLKLFKVNYDKRNGEARAQGSEHAGAIEPQASETDLT